VINPAVGPKTLPEVIAYAKRNPGKLAYGSAGLGTSSQLRVEMLKFRAKVDILHVPYRGSADALNDLLPNTVQMMNEINVFPHVKAGKLTLLNINYPTRHPDFPDVPTLTELGFPDSDVPIWYSMQAPAGTPREIVEKLNAKIVEIAATDDMKARMRAINVVVPLQTPEQLAQHLVADIKATDELIRNANIKLE
jgi:tripartite-type tricarboxylate transporter receptor subunit TctC